MIKSIFKIPKELLPQVKEKYPFVYLEKGRIEVDDRSIKFINSENEVISIPCGIINCILLSHGTSITHEAIKILSEYNCNVFWVGEQGIHFYAYGLTPTHDTRNFMIQCELSCNSETRLIIAKKLFKYRFPNDDVSNKTLNQLMGMEGKRVKNQYIFYSEKYNIKCDYRNEHITEFEEQDVTNKYLTIFNQFLYAILCSATISMGYSPHIGFIHKSSPLPFIYDMSDLYKEKLCIEPAFRLASKFGIYDEIVAKDEFIKNIIEIDLLKKYTEDLTKLFEEYK